MFLSKSMHFSCARALEKGPCLSSVNFINLLDQEVLWLIMKSKWKITSIQLFTWISLMSPTCTNNLSVLAIWSHQTNLNKMRKQTQKKRTKRDNKIPKSLIFSLSVFSSMLPVSFCHSIPHTRSKSSFLQRQGIHFTQTRCASCRDPVSTLLFNMHHAFWMFPTFHPWQRDTSPSQSHQVSPQDSDTSPHLPSTPFHQRHVFVKLPAEKMNILQEMKTYTWWPHDSHVWHDSHF